MPNELGLLTKQEAKAIRDLRLLPSTNPREPDVLFIARLIREVQGIGDNQTRIEFNKIVHEDVAKYFKNTVGYDVVEQPVATPANHTKIVSISWL